MILEDRTAIVTGAGSRHRSCGIGCHGAGGRLRIVTDRDLGAAEETVERIAKAGGRAEALEWTSPTMQRSRLS